MKFAHTPDRVRRSDFAEVEIARERRNLGLGVYEFRAGLNSILA